MDDKGVPIEPVEYRELRFVDGMWKIRTEREDKGFIPELGGWIFFNTRLHYDLDRSFGPEINRALPSPSTSAHEMPTRPSSWLNQSESSTAPILSRKRTVLLRAGTPKRCDHEHHQSISHALSKLRRRRLHRYSGMPLGSRHSRGN